MAVSSPRLLVWFSSTVRDWLMLRGESSLKNLTGHLLKKTPAPAAASGWPLFRLLPSVHASAGSAALSASDAFGHAPNSASSTSTDQPASLARFTAGGISQKVATTTFQSSRAVLRASSSAPAGPAATSTQPRTCAEPLLPSASQDKLIIEQRQGLFYSYRCRLDQRSEKYVAMHADSPRPWCVSRTVSAQLTRRWYASVRPVRA